MAKNNSLKLQEGGKVREYSFYLPQHLVNRLEYEAGSKKTGSEELLIAIITKYFTNNFLDKVEKLRDEENAKKSAPKVVNLKHKETFFFKLGKALGFIKAPLPEEAPRINLYHNEMALSYRAAKFQLPENLMHSLDKEVAKKKLSASIIIKYAIAEEFGLKI
jgi:hypothetical protein